MIANDSRLSTPDTKDKHHVYNYILWCSISFRFFSQDSVDSFSFLIFFFVVVGRINCIFLLLFTNLDFFFYIQNLLLFHLLLLDTAMRQINGYEFSFLFCFLFYCLFVCFICVIFVERQKGTNEKMVNFFSA